MENSGVANPRLLPVVIDEPKRVNFVDPYFGVQQFELRSPYAHPAEILGNILFPVLKTLLHPSVANTLRKVYLARKEKNKRKRKHRKECKRGK